MTQEIVEQLKKLNEKIDILIALQMVEEKTKTVKRKNKIVK